MFFRKLLGTVQLEGSNQLQSVCDSLVVDQVVADERSRLIPSYERDPLEVADFEWHTLLTYFTDEVSLATALGSDSTRR